MHQNAATMGLISFVIIACLTQSVTTSSNHSIVHKTKIEQDVEIAIKDFSRNCTDIVRKHVVEKKLRQRRTGFINFPALRSNPEGVKGCTLSLVGDMELQDPESQREKLCNAIRTCAYHLDPSACSKMDHMPNFVCFTIVSVLLFFLT